MLGQHPFELSLQIADSIAQESKLGLERLDAGLKEGTLAADVPGPGGDEDVVIFLDQRQRLRLERHVPGVQAPYILRQEMLLEVGVLLQFRGPGSRHPGFVGFDVRRQGGNILALVFCPQVGFLVDNEEVAQLLQAHGINIVEQDRILPLEVIGSRHDNSL
ncbi:MAG: hypothetical protein M3R47_12940 [Chloroflexota bacterium]|nr:hypothetical protein [Chloroflexota bacterium]